MKYEMKKCSCCHQQLSKLKPGDHVNFVTGPPHPGGLIVVAPWEANRLNLGPRPTGRIVVISCSTGESFSGSALTWKRIEPVA